MWITKDNPMSTERAALETKGVTGQLLTRVDLGPEGVTRSPVCG